MKNIFRSCLIIFWLFFASNVHAETLTGVVRSVIHQKSKSFSLDMPPTVRVYVNSATQFEAVQGRASFEEVREGSNLEVEAKPQNSGTYIATRIKILGELKPISSDDKKFDVKLNQSFFIKVGQQAVVTDSSKPLKIQALRFINTLCREGAVCEGEGDVGMRMKVFYNGDKDEIMLTSKDSRKPYNPIKVEILGHELQLIESGEDVILMVVREL